jgi:DNA repair exonuclease SbcCD nuclease subunit
MKMLVVGDIHLRHKDISRSTLLIDALIKVMKDKKPDFAVLLGDVFDNHNVVYSECMALFCRFLDETRFVQKFHILGNHEMPDSVTLFPKIHALVPLLNHRDTECVYYDDWPSYNPIVAPRVCHIGNTGVGFIPYVPPKTEFSNVLSDMVKKSKPRIVFCHQEFSGSRLTGNKPSEKGDDPFDFGTELISGHIHGQQKMNHLWYPGTPIQQDFGESPDKAVYMIEIDPCSDTSYSILERIELPGIPKLITHPLSVAEAMGFEIEEDGNYHRIGIYGTKADIAAFRATEKFEKIMTMGKVKLVPMKDEAIASAEKKSGRDFKSIFLSYLLNENLGDLYEDMFKKH